MALIFYHDQYINFSKVAFKSTFSQEVLKILKLKPLFFKKKVVILIIKNTALFHFFSRYQKLLKRLFMTIQRGFWGRSKFCTGFNRIFEKNRSTNTCLGHLTDKITTEFEKALFTCMILIDLQKQFGTIDYQISLKKTKYLAFSKNTIAWFKSYLHEQKFKTSINNIYLSWKD